MGIPEKVYLIVVAPSGATMAARDIEFSRINGFLDGIDAEKCLVYDLHPAMGGSLLRTLRLDSRTRQWT
jgi:hypothetical protein